MPEAGAGAGVVLLADPESAGRRGQVPSERAQAWRVRQRARRAGEPGARPAAPGVVHVQFHAAVLPAPVGGLADLDAAVCLCTALRDNVLTL